MEDTQDKAHRINKPVIIKFRSGKHSVDIFSIVKYRGKCGNSTAYAIDHIPTGLEVGRGYYYISLARSIANELASKHGGVLSSSDAEFIRKELPQHVQVYAVAYQYSPVKQAETIDEWRNGPDYQDILNRINGGTIPFEQEGADSSELWDGDLTLAWVPSSGIKGLAGIDMAALIDGRRSPGESLSKPPHRDGNSS